MAPDSERQWIKAMAMTLRNDKTEIRVERQQYGFTYIEVMIAVVVLMVGLVGVLSIFACGIGVMQFAQEDLIAKQKAREALESIYGARNTAQITYNMIQNVSSGGIFLDGLQPLLLAGNDGIIGTADDGAIETLRLPGPDGIYGTADDVNVPLANFQRQIQITPVPLAGGGINPDLRQISVTVQYSAGKFMGGNVRTYTVSSYISRFR
jgi:type II secretory pathway pseudopilin PulG